MTKPVWPKHTPSCSVHDIVFDNVCRGLSIEQTIEETCGLATTKMVEFYRKAVDLMIEKEHQ